MVRSFSVKGRWLAPVACSVCLAGCVATSDYKNFDGSGTIRVTDDLKFTFSLRPKNWDFHVPLVYNHYHSREPFGLRLELYDYSKSYRSLTISEIVVEYADGEVVRKTDGWSWPLKSRTVVRRSRSENVETEINVLTASIDELVPRHVDVKITLRGELIKENGERVPFERSEEFKAKSGFRTQPYWEYIANC